MLLSIYWILAATSAIFLVLRRKFSPNYRDIPTIGPTGLGPISYYHGAFNFLFNASQLIQQGYDKHKNSIFKIASIDRWMVIVSGTQLVEDLVKAKDDQLSLIEAANEVVQVRYTMDIRVHDNPYHIPLIRSLLTRKFPVIFDALRDEIMTAFTDNISLREDEWTAVPVFEAVTRIVCRTTNRVFVGLPLCRNSEYLDLTLKYALDVSYRATLINMFPALLKPLVGRLLTKLPENTRRGIKHLEPLIQERQRCIEKYGKEYPGKPEDMLSWLMDVAEGEERSAKSLTLRILTINFAAIHTSSMSLTHALFDLVASPQCIEPLREEVQECLREHGWTKTGLDKMRKLDSFLKESQRMNGVGLTVTRMALKPFTFSNGMTVPAGAIITAASTPTHHDPNTYERPYGFNGFRFAERGLDSDEGRARHLMVAAHPDYIPFGLGRHACPGRFFAVNEFKTMLAHVLLSYDVRLKDPTAGRPANKWIMTACVPNTEARLMFRKRQSS